MDRTDDTADTRGFFSREVRAAMHEEATRGLPINSGLAEGPELLGLADMSEEELASWGWEDDGPWEDDEGWTLVLPGDPLFAVLLHAIGNPRLAPTVLPGHGNHTAADCAVCPVRGICPARKTEDDG
jgi:hypothetical protein